MSIFARAISIDADDHTERCARWVPLDDGVCCSGQLLVTPDRRYRYDNTRPCTCHTGPLRYDGSHILPSGDGPRAGSVDLAEIPGFITDPESITRSLGPVCGGPIRHPRLPAPRTPHGDSNEQLELFLVVVVR